MHFGLGVLLVSSNAKLPTRSTDRAQCIDFYAAEDVEIHTGETVVVDLGVKVVIPNGYTLEFRERSGLATRGIIIGAGVIDEDYHGPLKAVVRYFVPCRQHWAEDEVFKITTGDKIVQAELVERIPFSVRQINETTLEHAIENSERGERGFGSTG